ncbi:hypothetical protein HDV06_004536 [Boothiomyces sp. JEL0866]|nr:hypothetical protein HDV06_004536 [Boothiomyces sp. JEL0866]
MTAQNIQLWKPTAKTNSIKSFQSFVNDKYNLRLGNYDELYKFSIDNISSFWESVWEFCKIKSSKSFDSVIDESTSIDTIPKWFGGSRLNYAENLLPKRDDSIAIIGVGETSQIKTLTFKELAHLVGRISAAFRAAGIQVGDRICGYVPNCPESVAFMLATAAVGAIWSSASPDFGEMGVLDRFAQISPKILVSVESVTYNGKQHDNLTKLKGIVEGLPTLQKVVVIPFVEKADVSPIQKAVTLEDFLSNFPDQEPQFEQVPFDHPLAILYSSGTTGVPKCIVHSHGGTLIQHMKEHVIHGGLSEKDVLFYYTTAGWMMWNWLLSGLAAGATIVTYDGSPFKPSPARLWELTEELGITAFGASAKYFQALQEARFHPNKKHNVETIHSIYSTGSPLKPESYEFIYSSIKNDVLVGSITGGTDICSLFAGHNVDLPVYKGEIQCRCLGMAVEAWDDHGKPVYDLPGDLVCTKPFPAMPVSFWNDPKGEKYQNAYFKQVKGVWYHGDFLTINSATGGIVMLGRSDGTLNPNGVRFGSAELYNIMVQFPEVADSVAVGQKQDDDERVILFCKMADGQEFSEDLVLRIKSAIRSLLSVRHVPAKILPIADIPYTLTGKKVEVAIKKILSGQTVKPSTSLANPDSLKLYYNLPELQ